MSPLIAGMASPDRVCEVLNAHIEGHAAGICVGKLDLYVAAGGFHPSRVMPVVVDVGTDNATLLNEPLYMGLKHKRMRGRKFVELMDEIITALTQRYPKAVLQFEDFAIDRAKPLLERYRYDHLVFNDDIQVRRGLNLAALGVGCGSPDHVMHFSVTFHT
jgi:malic enzyme